MTGGLEVMGNQPTLRVGFWLFWGSAEEYFGKSRYSSSRDYKTDYFVRSYSSSGTTTNTTIIVLLIQ